MPKAIKTNPSFGVGSRVRFYPTGRFHFDYFDSGKYSVEMPIPIKPSQPHYGVILDFSINASVVHVIRKDGCGSYQISSVFFDDVEEVTKEEFYDFHRSENSIEVLKQYEYFIKDK